MSHDATTTRSASRPPEDHVQAAFDPARLLDAVVCAVVGLDAHGRILSCNQPAEALFGVSRLEVRGRAFGALLSGRHRRAFGRGLARAARNGRSVTLLGVRRPTAGECPVELTLTRGGEAGAPWFAASLLDVSSRRRTEALLRHRARVAQLGADVGLALTRPGPIGAALERCARAVVDRMDVALARIWVLDDGDTELHLKASAGAGEGLGRAVLDATRIPVGAPGVGRVAATREPSSTSTRGVTCAGHPLLIDDVLIGVVAVYATHPLTDVDAESLGAVARKLALGIARQRVVDGLRQRAAELTRSTRALERSYRDLDQFAYIASHDLKAPLRGIGNLAQWIEEDLGEQVPDTVRDHVRLLHGRVQRMEGLIDAILEYSRAGRIQMTEEPVDTGALVREAIDLLGPDPSVPIVIDSAMPVLVAPRLPLLQVFQNLIGNALKYGRQEHPRIEIGAEPLPGAVRFHVRDNGPGIAPAYHERIWRVFQRLEARDVVEGAGIGLSLVKKIVEAVGGEVALDSREGAGATFFVTWPDRRGEEA